VRNRFRGGAALPSGVPERTHGALRETA